MANDGSQRNEIEAETSMISDDSNAGAAGGGGNWVSEESNAGAAGGGGGGGPPPDWERVLQDLREEVQGLRTEVQKIPGLETEVEVVTKKVDGIRNALAPATIYALLESSVAFVFEKQGTPYTNRAGYPATQKELARYLQTACSFANYALCRMLNVVSDVWKPGQLPQQQKTLYKEALGGLVIFLGNIPKRYLVDGNWPPHRNHVAHNGTLSKAVCNAIDRVPNLIPLPGNLEALTDSEAATAMNGIMTTKMLNMCQPGDAAIGRCKNLLKARTGDRVSRASVDHLKNVVSAAT